MNRLYLVRHGENVANLTLEFSSRRVDYSLTAKGVLQAQQTAEYMAGLDIDAIYASPLKRARETAEIIGAPLGLAVEVLDEFREIDVGNLELGPPTPEAWAYHNEVLLGWLDGRPDRAFPGGDDYYTLVSRMRAGLAKVVAGREGCNLVVVGHGGIFTMTLPDLCPGVEPGRLFSRLSQNCSVTEIAIDWRQGRLVGELVNWASHAHLTGEAAKLVLGIPG